MPKPGGESDWKKPTVRDAVRATAYAFREAWRHARAPLIARLVCMALQAAIPGAQVFVLAAAIRAVEAGRGFDTLAVKLFCALGGLMVIGQLAGRLGFLAASHVSFRLRAPQAERYFYSVDRVPLESFDNPDFHDQLNWGGTGVDGVADLVNDSAVGVVQTALASIGVLAQLVPVSPFLPALVVFVSAPTLIFTTRFNRHALIAKFGLTASKRKADYWEQLLTRRESRAEIQHLGLSDEGLNRWDASKGDVLKEQTKLATNAFAKLAGLQAIDTAVLLLLILWIAWNSLGKAVEVATLVAGVYALQSYSEQLRRLGYGTRVWWRNVAPVTCLMRMIGETPARAEEGCPMTDFDRLQMCDVGFQYPSASVDALHDVNVLLEVGKSYAVVGENGAGKSTFVKVVCGLYTPTSGEYSADGVPLDDQKRLGLRAAAAMAFQDSVRLPVPMRDNLTACTDTPEEAVKRIVKQCGLDDLIDSLPRGMDTEMGRATEGSVDISSGQWQRVALARALLKGARVVVFDEPASAQDPLSELNLYRGVVSREPSRITIVVSHRLAVATLADEVIYFEAGRIVAKGTHAEVMRASPSYAADFEEQARLYVEAPSA